MPADNRNEHFYETIETILSGLTTYNSDFNINSDYDGNYPYGIVFIGNEEKEFIEDEGGYEYPIGGNTEFHIAIYFKTNTSQNELSDLRKEAHNWISRTEKVFSDNNTGVTFYTDPITSEIIGIRRIQLNENIKAFPIDSKNTGVVAFEGEIEYKNNKT